MTNYKITINDTRDMSEVEYRNRKPMNLDEAIERATIKAFGTPCKLFQNSGLPKGYGSFVHETGTVHGEGKLTVETI